MGDAWIDRAGVLARYSRELPSGPSIYEFRTPRRDWIGYALDHWSWDPRARVLDAGCGSGAYLEALRQRVPEGALVGLDLTLSRLLSSTRPSYPRVALVAADVQALPLATGSLDVVLSAHMLYRVPDIASALAEFRRVLRHGGALLAIYDSEIDDQPEMDELFLACGGRRSLNQLTNRFSLESAPDHLSAAFDDVAVHTERPVMLVPDADAVVAGLDDLRAVAEAHLDPTVSWEEMLARARLMVVKAIEEGGCLPHQRTQGRVHLSLEGSTQPLRRRNARGRHMASRSPTLRAGRGSRGR